MDNLEVLAWPRSIESAKSLADSDQNLYAWRLLMIVDRCSFL